MANPDPLSSLRQYNVNEEEITEREGHIIFGELSWPKTVKTNYLRHRLRKEGPGKDYYSLECLLFLLKNVSLKHPVYCRRAAAENIPAIKRPDRENLLAYLFGKTTNCISIDKTVISEIPTQVKRSALLKSPGGMTKRICLENNVTTTNKEKFDVTTKKISAPVDNIKLSLSDAISMEKIADIRAKRLAKKMNAAERYGKKTDVQRQINEISNSDFPSEILKT